MSAPLITIGMTCYNAAATIERALRSALAQDWPNFEIIVVEDFSTDDSALRIAPLAAQEPKITLIRRAENGGPGAARADLLAAAKGEFLCFFDDDDESLPARVRRQYETIVAYERQSGVTRIACFASGERLYPNGYLKPLPAIGSRPVAPYGPDLAAYLLYFHRHADWFYGSGTPACALMARRQVFLEAGGFDASLRRVEDVDFAIRLALAGGHFIGCAESLLIQHATVAADKSAEKNRDAAVRLAKKYGDWLQARGMRDYARRWPYARYYHFTRQYGRLALLLAELSLRYPLRTLRHATSSGWRRLRHERRLA